MNAGRTASALRGVALIALLVVAGCSQSPEQAASAGGGTNILMLIEPHVAVGKLHAGMTVQQVVSELGEPARRTANALEYPALGLAVMPGDGPIQVVMCGDVTGLNGPFVSAFKGRTKEGIGMKSTKAEIVRAYGEPDKDEKMRLGLESMTYPSLAITFTLENEQVHHMIVRLGQPSEPDRAIAIEPAAPAK